MGGQAARRDRACFDFFGPFCIKAKRTWPCFSRCPLFAICKGERAVGGFVNSSVHPSAASIPLERAYPAAQRAQQRSRLCCLAERTADYFWVAVAQIGGWQIPKQQDYAVVQEVNDRRTCQLAFLPAFRWRHQPYKSRTPRPASISAEVQRKNSRKGWAVCHSRTASATHKAASSHTVVTYSSGYRLKSRNMVNGYWLIKSVADGAADRAPRRCWR